eukprot:4694465-Pyramimonas_sp.AAC.1
MYLPRRPPPGWSEGVEVPDSLPAGGEFQPAVGAPPAAAGLGGPPFVAAASAKHVARGKDAGPTPLLGLQHA